MANLDMMVTSPNRHRGASVHRSRLFRKSLAAALSLSLIVLAVGVTAVLAQDDEAEKTVGDLWIDLLIGPPLIQPFNEVARADDIAHVDRPEQLGQLADVTPAQKMLIFKSAAEAEERLPDLAGQIAILGYNLEHGPGTPPEEQADPLGAIQQMRGLADQYGLKLALGPDHDFALAHGPALAPYVDIFVLQVQRRQTEPPVVIDFVSTLVPQLRAANDQLQISVQVRTEGDVGALIGLLETLLPYIDGVSILTSPQTVDVAEELLQRLRGQIDTPTRSLYLPLIIGDRG